MIASITATILSRASSAGAREPARPAAPPSTVLTFRPIGPLGGDVRSLATDPSDRGRVYAGTADGILYASNDAGASWFRLDPGVPVRGASLDDILVAADGIVYAGFWRLDGAGGGLMRSRDRGITFEGIGRGLDGEAVRGFARSPSHPDVFAVVTASGVFRSEDGAQTFSRISPVDHPSIRLAGSVVIDPESKDRIYVGTARLAWSTADGGRTWAPIQRGMIHDSDVMTLSIDRRRAATLYATACTGIWRSRDRGLQWSKVLGIPQVSRRTRAFAQDRDRSETFYAGTTDGIYVSSDDAASFRRATAPGLIVNAIVSLGGGRVLAGVEGEGLVASDDFGRTWTVANAGFRERQIRLVALDAERQRLYAVAGPEGSNTAVLFERDELSASWARRPLPAGREITAISVAARGDVGLGTDQGLFLLDGATRTTLSRARLDVPGEIPQGPPPRVNALRLEGPEPSAGTSHGLFRSSPALEAWRHETLGNARGVVAIGPGPGERPVAATPLQLFDLGSPLPRELSGAPEPTVKTFGFLPHDPDIAFIGSARGLLRSRDGGRTWIAPEAYPMRRVTALAFHADGRRVFAADADVRTVYASSDRGERFWPITARGLPSQRVFAMAVTTDRIVLAASGGGLLEAALDPGGPEAASAVR